MKEITIPLVLFIFLLIMLGGQILTWILEKIDKTLDKKLKLEKEKFINAMNKKGKLK